MKKAGNSAISKKSRLLILDPVCVLLYGHNLAAIRNLRAFVGHHFNQVVAIGSKYLEKNAAMANQIETLFEYCYNQMIPIKHENTKVFLASHEDKIEASINDLLFILKTYEVNSLDTLCYPSIDFYALFALSECAERIIELGSPKILLRLIGVMENAASDLFYDAEIVVHGLIQNLVEKGLDIEIAAETPKYADHLAAMLNRTVTVAANIEIQEQNPLRLSDGFNVVCPGSARYDKGFLDLLQIFSFVRSKDKNIRIKFDTQVLQDIDLKNQMNYLTKLYALPGVTLLPCTLPADEILALYRKADLILLPYAQDVYQFRGSAVLIEAICTGSQVIAYDGCAFSDQIRFFGAGIVCQNAQEMAKYIVENSKISPTVRHSKARQTRERFTRDLIGNYKNWVLQ